MLKWFFKPVRKIGDDVLVQGNELPSTNIADEILRVGNIDAMCKDIVKSRLLLCMHTDSMEQLFDCMTRQKDVTSQSQIGVSLSLYFRGMRLAPSECILRLSEFINNGNRVPSKIYEDLSTLRDELIRLKSI